MRMNRILGPTLSRELTLHEFCSAVHLRPAILRWLKGKSVSEAWTLCNHGPAMLLVCTAHSGAGYKGWHASDKLVGIYLNIFEIQGLPLAGEYQDVCKLLLDSCPKSSDRIPDSSLLDEVRWLLDNARKRRQQAGEALSIAEHVLDAAYALGGVTGEGSCNGKCRNSFYAEGELFLAYVLRAHPKDRRALCHWIADLCRSRLSPPDMRVFANSIDEKFLADMRDPHLCMSRSILLGRRR